MNKYMVEILKEMCKRVGGNYDRIVFSENEWWRVYSWTEEEEADFKVWFEEYLYNNTRARKELTTCGKSKKCIKQAVSEFLLQYSWRYR